MEKMCWKKNRKIALMELAKAKLETVDMESKLFQSSLLTQGEGDARVSSVH